MTEFPPKSYSALVAAAGIATAAPDDEVNLYFAKPAPRPRVTLPPISAGSWFKRKSRASAVTTLAPEGPTA